MEVWLAKVEALMGKDVFEDAAELYNFGQAWEDGETPEEAVKDCLDWLE